ncbi:hypothetical protein [Agromyces sp. Soil535]|uniref:DUF6993 domain-containing protein n=1 Tax=Agromyces sp. Soil535 TaxID=1736390 RepID=UPI0006FDDDA7|nr:hypothetical protein [Agromyces sp. Soil535]KRE30196.1 hypothetical protein ASG80_18345 [Agromyces sp. Soil535]
MRGRLGTTAALALAGAALVAGVAGCAWGPPADPTSSSPVAAAETTAPTASAPPILRQQLSASENVAFFDAVNLAVIAANSGAGGRDFIDALVAAGFDKAQMQVTADRTTVDVQADSVQFAVLFQSECLVGQYGPASGGYHSAVRPALGAGGCLVGQTRPIDW